MLFLLQVRKYGAAEEQALSSRTTHVVARPELTAAEAATKLGSHPGRQLLLPTGISFVIPDFFSDSIKQVGGAWYPISLAWVEKLRAPTKLRRIRYGS